VARHVSVTLVDDLDGSEASDTVSFALDGKTYEIDLSDSNATKLREALTPFAAAARRGGGSARRSTTPRTAASPRPTYNRERTAAIRDWARKNGHKVSERGRIPTAVIEAYEHRDAVPAGQKAPKKSRKKLQAVG
jgi:nucleoid-associated protein Lsr2